MADGTEQTEAEVLGKLLATINARLNIINARIDNIDSWMQQNHTTDDEKIYVGISEYRCPDSSKLCISLNRPKEQSPIVTLK